MASPVQVNGYKVWVRCARYLRLRRSGQDQGHARHGQETEHSPPTPTRRWGQTMLSGAYINLKIGKSAKAGCREEIPSGTSNGMMESISNEIMPAISQIMPKIDSLLFQPQHLCCRSGLYCSPYSVLDGITANVLGVTGGPQQHNVARRAARGARCPLHHPSDRLGKRQSPRPSKTLKQLPIATTMANVNDITANLSNFATKTQLLPLRRWADSPTMTNFTTV